MPNDLLYWENTAQSHVENIHPLYTQLLTPEKTSNWAKILQQLSPEDVTALYQHAQEKLK